MRSGGDAIVTTSLDWDHLSAWRGFLAGVIVQIVDKRTRLLIADYQEFRRSGGAAAASSPGHGRWGPPVAKTVRQMTPRRWARRALDPELVLSWELNNRNSGLGEEASQESHRGLVCTAVGEQVVKANITLDLVVVSWSCNAGLIQRRRACVTRLRAVWHGVWAWGCQASNPQTCRVIRVFWQSTA